MCKLPLRSIFANSIPVTAVFACAISDTNSPAAALCFNNGCTSGDSNTGSIGSKGLIKWHNMHNFGSGTYNKAQYDKQFA